MSHALEIGADGKAKMAYSGEVPWHGLGKKVPSDLTPIQMLDAAGLDWTVEKVPLSTKLDGIEYKSKNSVLRRSDAKGLGSVIGEVSNDWKPVQNHEAAEFFNDFVMAGDMEMHTAGSLHNGEIVWFLAKMKESFELFKGDVTESYMLFTNPHRYAMSQSTSLTTVRVVCQNTLRLSHEETKGSDIVRMSHRNKFNPDLIKEKIGVSKHKLAKYKEQAQFLGKKKAKKDDIVDYFKTVFPFYQNKSGKDLSKNAELAISILDSQPGADFAKGTWWQPFNAATFLVDHHIGKTDDSRMENAWYGPGARTKALALKTAMEMAA